MDKPAAPESTEMSAEYLRSLELQHAETLGLTKPAASPVAGVSAEKVYRDYIGALRLAYPENLLALNVAKEVHDILAQPSAEGDGCPSHKSQHWNNPETGYAECECCCGWALDYERLRKERDEALATIERLRGCVASLESQNASKAAYIAAPVAKEGRES